LNKKILFYLLIFCAGIISAQDSGCDLPENSIYLNNNDDVLYNVDFNIGGFQFTIDGTTVSDAYGGAAEDAEFTVSTSNSVVLGFSFLGSYIPAGCGILTQLNLNGISTGLSNSVFSDENGTNKIVTVTTIDCNGDYNGSAIEGCDGICGSGLIIDVCGICGGVGDVYECGCYDIPDGDCDCACNVLDNCGICGGDDETCSDCEGNINGDIVVDGCNICGGDGESCTQAEHLLFSRIVISPNQAEMVEIYNPTDEIIWLKESNPSHSGKGYYLTDGTNPDSDYYYNYLPSLGQENFNSGEIRDFFISFPLGTSIDPGEKYRIAIHDNSTFFNYFNYDSDNSLEELYENNFCYECYVNSNVENPFANNYVANLDVLGDNGEVLVLFYWDGESSRLEDVDYFLWGDSTYGVNKTGIGDFDEDTSLDEQTFMVPSPENYSYVRIINEEIGQRLDEGNGIKDQDQTGENLNETWQVQENSEKNFGCIDDTICLNLDNSCGNYCALNYNPNANIEDGSCIYNQGCMDSLAENYDSQATSDDGSCLYNYGCTDDAYAGICEFDGIEDEDVICDGDLICDEECSLSSDCSSSRCIRKGNYDASATIDYGSCVHFNYPSVELMLSDYYCDVPCTTCHFDTDDNETCDAAESGFEVSIYGKLIDYFKISDTFWVITIVDEEGSPIEIVPGEGDSDWVLGDSFLSYLVDDPYNYSEYIVSIKGTMGEYEGQPQMKTSGQESSIDDFIRQHPEGEFINDEGSKITSAEIVVAPYVLIPTLGERINFMYSFPEESRVIIRIFSLDGRFVTSLVDQYYEYSGTVLRVTDNSTSNQNTSSWDGRNHLGQVVSPGTYLIHIEATNFKTGSTSTDVAPIVVGVPN